mmetsp:Transcript_52006/g.123169  ORF Transcript_52006/g.123169 Transcript_52006/m.123169 type:complete len:408 (+) Transcript_52006:407-1630(+)
MVESTAEPRGGPGRAAAPTAEELSRGREERAASYPSPFSSLREQMPFSASTHAMEGDPGANAPSPRPLPRVFPTMRENSYSRFSSSTQKLGMMIAGEAGPRSPRGEESPPSGEGIAGWCPIMPTAGVGPMGGANRNLLVKASWHQFVIFSRMPEEVIEEFLSRMRPRTFVSGQKIIHEGAVGTSLFLVDYGTVQAVMGTRVLQELASGECVGEMGLLSTIRKLKEERKDWTLNLRSCNVVAVTNCRLLELTVEKVIEVMRTAGWSATDLAKMLEPMETMEKVKRENISRHLISRMAAGRNSLTAGANSEGGSPATPTRIDPGGGSPHQGTTQAQWGSGSTLLLGPEEGSAAASRVESPRGSVVALNIRLAGIASRTAEGKPPRGLLYMQLEMARYSREEEADEALWK